MLKFQKGTEKMKYFNIVIKDPLGIHARPAGLIVKEISKYDSNVKIELNDKLADAKRIFAVMGLGAKCGDTLKITIDGRDEDQAVVELKAFFEKNL